MFLAMGASQEMESDEEEALALSAVVQEAVMVDLEDVERR